MAENQSPFVWGFPANSRKAHAFRRSDAGIFLARSLCMKYGYHNMVPDRMDPETGKKSPDDCAKCRKRVDAEAASG